LQQVKSVTHKLASGRVEAFTYPAGPDAPSLPAWDGWESSEEAASQSPEEANLNAKNKAGEAQLHGEFELRLAEEKLQAFEAGREQGRQQGLQEAEKAQAAAQSAAQSERVRQAAGLLDKFAQERDRYLRAVEHEVVKLALAVAARILRREAQMDPLLLTGAVRVALGQLSASTQVRLCVPSAELDLWAEAIALVPRLAVKPVVAAGEGMLLGDCEIETEMGSVDLGIRAQLGEIERGFFDRAGSASSGVSGAPEAEPVEISADGNGRA
jgi:flagellar assembly protein FliH